jgi:plastocyanin
MKTIFQNLNRKLLIPALALIIIGGVFYFAGCKKDSNPGPDQVFMQGYSFNPITITVPVNTTITWYNKGNMNHTATSNDSTLFNSGAIVPGAAYSYKFTTPGTYPYYCIYHIQYGMTGTVVVQ